MIRGRRKRWGFVGILCASASLGLTWEVPGQAADKPVGRAAEVTGNDVYVRSGPSLNHYTIAKLHAGDRVTVVGETGEWYEILPPDGVFSLISGDYVDLTNEVNGVVNASHVRVRAGSLLSDSKYTVQTKLSKGDAVVIMGRNPDGFLRIKPPTGTTVWINRDFAEFVPGSMIQLEKDVAGGATASGKETASTSSSDGTGAGEAVVRVDSTTASEETNPFEGLPETEQRTRLLAIDEAARAEAVKPMLERRLQGLIRRYSVIAEQNEDKLAQRYAKARIEQLTNMNELMKSVRNTRRLSEEASSKRRAYLESRAKIRGNLPDIPSGLDVQGVLQVSALYPVGSFPRRYRLVDADGPLPRTLGYVEFPIDSSLNVEEFVGNRVGVRTLSKRLHSGGVDSVPIYVAGELVLLDAKESGAAESGRDQP